jgi:hypothetical protein
VEAAKSEDKGAGTMRIIRAALLIVAGMAAVLAMQAVPGLVRAAPGLAPQQVTPMPMPVPPNVVVTNEPTVNARQAGPWTFQLRAEQPLAVAPVHLAAPTFLQQGVRYSFLWAADAKPETEMVLGVEPGGWALVAGDPSQIGAVWVNVSRALRVERVSR